MIPVSFVVPVRNGAPWLRDVIQSIANQADGRPMEIIVVDDGSSDDSRRIAETLETSCPLQVLDAGWQRRSTVELPPPSIQSSARLTRTSSSTPAGCARSSTSFRIPRSPRLKAATRLRAVQGFGRESREPMSNSDTTPSAGRGPGTSAPGTPPTARRRSPKSGCSMSSLGTASTTT